MYAESAEKGFIKKKNENKKILRFSAKPSSEESLGPCQTSLIELLAKNFNG